MRTAPAAAPGVQHALGAAPRPRPSLTEWLTGAMVRATDRSCRLQSGGDADVPSIRDFAVVRSRDSRIDVRAARRRPGRRSGRAAEADSPAQAGRGGALAAVRDPVARVVRSWRIPGAHRVLGAVRDPRWAR